MAHFYPISYTSVFKEKKVTFHFFFLENLRGNKILLIFFFFFKETTHDCRAGEVYIFHNMGGEPAAFWNGLERLSLCPPAAMLYFL